MGGERGRQKMLIYKFEKNYLKNDYLIENINVVIVTTPVPSSSVIHVLKNAKNR